MTFVTDFADQAVLLPLLLAGAAMLGVQRQWRLLAAWVLVLCGVSGVVLVLKVACYACGWMWPVLDADSADIRSPSGHVAASSVLYGSMLVLAVAGTRRAGVLVAALGALGVAGVIGATRIGLGAHSPAEVVLGAMLGVCGAIAFALLAGGRVPGRCGRPVLLAGALVIAVMHGRHLPAESAIQSQGAILLRRVVLACNPHWEAALDPARSPYSRVAGASATAAGPF